MTWYCSKRALKRGVTEVEEPLLVSEEWVWPSDYSGWFRIGRDVFDNLPDALADAEKRRAKKIAALRRQIEKLEKMTFGEDLK